MVWGADRAGWLSLDSILARALSPVFIVLACVVSAAVFLMKPKPTGTRTPYGPTDRILHRLAFATYPAQLALADIEDRQYAGKLAPIPTDRPVFISGLPRAGTTLLLELLAGSPEFGAHCYRDMPFVPIPCLWARFANRFQKHTEKQERAHGDGMLIDPDSPEAPRGNHLETLLAAALQVRPNRAVESGIRSRV